MSKHLKTNVVRIIAGRWRGRKITFPDLPSLRPSPDRVRETLFNWLQMHIVDARCLDCFAGSGVLGFEALSRGAKQVVFVDNDPLVLKALEFTKGHFHAENAVVRQGVMPMDLKRFQEKYDLIFLDPPFAKDLIPASIDALFRSQCLSEGGLVYIETELTPEKLILPETWEIIHQSHAGKVYYYLCQANKSTRECE